MLTSRRGLEVGVSMSAAFIISDLESTHQGLGFGFGMMKIRFPFGSLRSPPRALSTETNVERGTSQSKSGISVNLSNSGIPWESSARRRRGALSPHGPLTITDMIELCGTFHGQKLFLKYFL